MIHVDIHVQGDLRMALRERPNIRVDDSPNNLLAINLNERKIEQWYFLTVDITSLINHWPNYYHLSAYIMNCWSTLMLKRVFGSGTACRDGSRPTFEGL